MNERRPRALLSRIRKAMSRRFLWRKVQDRNPSTRRRREAHATLVDKNSKWPYDDLLQKRIITKTTIVSYSERPRIPFIKPASHDTKSDSGSRVNSGTLAVHLRNSMNTKCVSEAAGLKLLLVSIRGKSRTRVKEKTA